MARINHSSRSDDTLILGVRWDTRTEGWPVAAEFFATARPRKRSTSSSQLGWWGYLVENPCQKYEGGCLNLSGCGGAQLIRIEVDACLKKNT